MNRNRANIFDRRRNIENYEMAEQPIQDLQLAIQQLREQHQQAINALQQQIQQQRQENEWIPPMFQLTADQILNRFHKIKTFNARGDYTLQEFLSAVENVLTLCGNNADLLQHGLQGKNTRRRKNLHPKPRRKRNVVTNKSRAEESIQAKEELQTAVR